MKKSTFKSIVVLSLLLLCFGINAQNSSKIWTPVSESSITLKAKEFRNSVPTEYELFSLNSRALQTVLNNAPSRASLRTSNAIIELPVANGEMQKFRIVDASTFAPELQQRHPNIRSFAGQGIDDPTAIARFSTSPYGVNVMITSSKNATYYIDPYTKDKQAYIGYSRKDIPSSLEPFVCLVEDEVGPRNNTTEDNENATRNADDGILRTFRLALASNAEYSYFHWFVQAGIDPGAPDAEKKAAVLAAMNVAMTRVNGIFERDVSLTMEIIPNNEDIIFLNTATDGLSNDSSMINQIQAVIDNAIGFANYDIGHVFSTGGGGIAQLQSPCSANKARGVTGLPQPINDPFYVDYVAHEMGHQYGGNHTQNNNCQRSSASVEPGSASTIMGYAGICPPNVQQNSDDYFHAISVQEMWNFISVGNGQCAAQSPTNNLPPTADAGPDYTIPKSTPFVLKGIATDPDGGDVLSHCWEQMNPQVGPMPPQNTSVFGPMFRSIDPLASPDRYMPALPT
ncbi:MAG TPA: zinc-dependent metalloprotease family protein, partial [Aequorivita sp.]|nr:zinc-dependent metalloprotease family protein [Aequorivita sp.]